MSQKSLTSNSLGGKYNMEFICEPQFTAVFEHFRNISESDDNKVDLKTLAAEFRLLLNYFRQTYEQSERKTHKIIELSAELLSRKTKFEQNSSKLEEEKESLRIQLLETKKANNIRVKDNKELVRNIRRLKKTIEGLETQEKFLKEELEKSGKKEISTATKCTQIDEDMSQGNDEISEKPHKKSLKTKTSTAKRDNAVHNKYRIEIQKLRRKINILSVESRVGRDRLEHLKELFEKNKQHHTEAMQKLTTEKQGQSRLAGSLQKKNKSLESNVERFLKELNKSKDDKSHLEKDLEVALSDLARLREQMLDRDDDIERLKESVNRISKSKDSAFRRAVVFEKNLAVHCGRLTTAQKDIDVLNRDVKKLESELVDKELLLKLNEEQKQRLESSKVDEVEEQQKQVEFYKKQVFVREKRLAALKKDLDDNSRSLACLKMQLRKKGVENASLTTDLATAKMVIGTEQVMVNALKKRLDSEEISRDTLEKEVRDTKHRFQVMFKERNKFRKEVSQLEAIREYQDTHFKLLDKQQTFLRNNLKAKDAQVEKMVKKKRYAWAKF